MLANMIFRRLFHSTLSVPFSTSRSQFSNQSSLATLRKKTGYSIANCKKALENNGNDIIQAEAWLNNQAQSQGWEKATKLQNRITKNGLIGVACNKSSALIVEVNCETDFVARNDRFQSLVGKIAENCLNNLPQTNITAHDILKVNFDSEQLGQMQVTNESNDCSDSKTYTRLSDLLALNIGLIGENMSLRRAAAFSLPSAVNYKFACCTHPLTAAGEVLFGKYGAIITYQDNPLAHQVELPEGIELEKLPKQLCQHIIGMSPQSIERAESSVAGGEEFALLHQEFVANPEILVGELLDIIGWKVKGFIRFECGDS